MAEPTARDGEIIRLRNRTRALEAHNAELLARAEQAEAAIERAQEAHTSCLFCLMGLSCRIAAALPAPESLADAPTAVTAATEAHGGAGEAQGG